MTREELKQTVKLNVDELLAMAQGNKKCVCYVVGYAIAFYLRDEHKKKGIDILYDIKGSIPEYINEQRNKPIMIAFVRLFPVSIVIADDDLLNVAIGFLDCVFAYNLADEEHEEMIREISRKLKTKAIENCLDS